MDPQHQLLVQSDDNEVTDKKSSCERSDQRVPDDDIEMQQPIPLSKTTFDAVINTVVPNSQLLFFKEWQMEIRDVVSSFNGFINRQIHVITSEAGYTEYVIVLVFDSLKNYLVWQGSEERASRVKQLVAKKIKVSIMNSYGCRLDGSASTEQGGSSPSANRILLQNSAVKIPRPLPPPKWKLSLILVAGVYSMVLIAMVSGQIEVMARASLPRGFVIFVVVSQQVVINVYTLLPLVISLPLIAPWLRKRPPIEQMHPVHRLFDQGLQLFTAKIEHDQCPPEVLRRLDRLESNISKLRAVNHSLDEEMTKLRACGNETGDMSELEPLVDPIYTSTGIPEDSDRHPQKNYVEETVLRASSYSDDNSRTHATLGKPNCSGPPITIAVKNYVKWECVLAFEKWTDKMDNAMKKWDGYLGMVRFGPKSDGDPFVNSFSFDTAEHLLAFTRSEERDILVRELDSLLEATSEAVLSDERLIHDAFTELFVPTGGATARRPPPLWKTVMLTIVPLHLLVWILGGNLYPYLVAGGLHPLFATFVGVTITVFINSYVGVPLMHSQFGEWLSMDRPPLQSNWLYTVLDSGFPEWWMQLAGFTAYVVICILCGVAK